MNQLQRRIFGGALGIRKLPDEDAAEFNRNRNRAVRCYCERHGWWSRRWFQQAVKWDDHLSRDWAVQAQHYEAGVDAQQCQTQFSFAPLLRSWHGADWLEAHTTWRIRKDLRVDKSTGLRAGRGPVSKRWHEGVLYARDWTL